MIMSQGELTNVTFPSFAVDRNDVLGISRHPLSHARCVFEHVPETIQYKNKEISCENTNWHWN